MAPLKSHPRSKVADFVRRRTALSAEPCLETHKTAKPAIHGRSVYNLHRPLTAKQPAQIHPGPLRGGEEQSNYILKQQSEASLACKHTSNTHTNMRIHGQSVCLLLEGALSGFGHKYVWSVQCGTGRVTPSCFYCLHCHRVVFEAIVEQKDI